MGHGRDRRMICDDPASRAAIVRSQKGWLAAGNETFDDPDHASEAQQLDPEQEAALLPDAIRERARDLSPGRNGGAPALQRTLREQFGFLAAFTGGPFAGYDTSCDMLPEAGSFSFGCFGTSSYQHRDRICSIRQDWAIGRVDETLTVGRVIGDTLRTVATREVGENGLDGCQAAIRGLGRATAVADRTGTIAASSAALPKLDADVGVEQEAGWVRRCLGVAD